MKKVFNKSNITESLVAELINSQFPQWSDLPIKVGEDIWH